MRDMKALLSLLALVAVMISVISLFWKDNIITTALLILIISVTFCFWRTRKDISYFTISAVIGPSMEAVCTYFGAWQYSNPVFLIPLWLPLAWGLAGIILRRLAYYFIGEEAG